MASDINKYGPAVLSMDNPHFLTLTWQNVEGNKIWESTREQIELHRLTREKINRKPNETYRALRKIETTSGTVPKLFNPHLHLVVDGQYHAEETLDRHIRKNKNRTSNGRPYVLPEAQDIKPCDDKSIMEMMKYCTKFVTEITEGPKKLIQIKDMYTIFSQIHGKQMVRSFGLDINDSDTYERFKVNPALSYIQDGSVALFDDSLRDWYDLSTGEGYSGLALVN